MNPHIPDPKVVAECLDTVYSTGTLIERALFAILASTGVRVTDGLSLRWESIEWDHTPPRALILMRKVKRPHYLLLDGVAVSNLQAIRRRKGLVFEGITRFDAYHMAQRFSGGQLGCHSFRHHRGRTAMQQNGNANFVAKLLGHSSVKTTMIYTDLMQDEIEAGFLMLK